MKRSKPRRDNRLNQLALTREFLAQQTPYAAPLPADRQPTEQEIAMSLSRRGLPVWSERDFQRLLATLAGTGRKDRSPARLHVQCNEEQVAAERTNQRSAAWRRASCRHNEGQSAGSRCPRNVHHGRSSGRTRCERSATGLFAAKKDSIAWLALTISMGIIRPVARALSTLSTPRIHPRLGLLLQKPTCGRQA